MRQSLSVLPSCFAFQRSERRSSGLMDQLEENTRKYGVLAFLSTFLSNPTQRMTKPRPVNVQKAPFLHINCQIKCFYQLFGTIICCEISPVTADSKYSRGFRNDTISFQKKQLKLCYSACPEWNPELSGLSIITPLLIFHKA